jgi:hypothetical protein
MEVKNTRALGANNSRRGGLAMHDLLMSENGASTVGFVAFCVCAALVALGCTIAVQWRKARQAELLTTLKKEMIERGMSAQEIQTVVRAGTDQDEILHS